MNGIQDITTSLGSSVVENVGRAVSHAQERSPLPVDLLESDDAYLALFDAPGATTQDVQVQYRDGVVEVRVDRFRGFHEGFEMRYPGRGLALDGRVELPPDASVEADAATATLRDDGTLAVRIPTAGKAVNGDGDGTMGAAAVDQSDE
jgi:HSP20 family protein